MMIDQLYKCTKIIELDTMAGFYNIYKLYLDKRIKKKTNSCETSNKGSHCRRCLPFPFNRMELCLNAKIQQDINALGTEVRGSKTTAC